MNSESSHYQIKVFVCVSQWPLIMQAYNNPADSPATSSVKVMLLFLTLQNACEIIRERLRPYKETNADWSWVDWVSSYTETCD